MERAVELGERNEEWGKKRKMAAMQMKSKKRRA